MRSKPPSVLVHEPTDRCVNLHCCRHNVDEPGDGYIVCGECGHLFPTRLHLWWVRLRKMYPLYWGEHPSRPPWRRPSKPDEDLIFPLEGSHAHHSHIVFDGFKPPTWRSWAWGLIRCPFIRPANITFCPECSHDF